MNCEGPAQLQQPGARFLAHSKAVGCLNVSQLELSSSEGQSLAQDDPQRNVIPRPEEAEWLTL